MEATLPLYWHVYVWNFWNPNEQCDRCNRKLESKTLFLISNRFDLFCRHCFKNLYNGKDHTEEIKKQRERLSDKIMDRYLEASPDFLKRKELPERQFALEYFEDIILGRA